MAAKKVVKKAVKKSPVKKTSSKPAQAKKAVVKKAAKKVPAKKTPAKKVVKKAAKKAPAKKVAKKTAEKKTIKASSSTKSKLLKSKTEEKAKKKMTKSTAVEKKATSKSKSVAKKSTEDEVRVTKGPLKREVKKTKKESILATLDLKKSFSFDVPNKKKEDLSTEDKLKALYQLQLIDSQIDKIRMVRGELPMEVMDLEDELQGLETRIVNIEDELKGLEEQTAFKKQSISDSKGMIKKYETQLNNVKNNREFDSLNKEIEFQKLEIQLSEKRIKEYTAESANKNIILDECKEEFNGRKQDLKTKKSELDNIIAETEKEEQNLIDLSSKAGDIIEERLLTAYRRIRQNAQNGLGVVNVERDSCGGCFNKIPPQRQMDIRQHKKVIVCEHCGRILVDYSTEEQ